MLRSHILQRTHITITLNPLGVSSDVGESYVCGALIIIFAIQWDLSYFVSRARVIYSCVCVCVCVLMCVRRYVFFFGVRIDLAWIRVTPSKRVTSVRVKFYTVVPNFRSPEVTSSIRAIYPDRFISKSLLFSVTFTTYC